MTGTEGIALLKAYGFVDAAEPRSLELLISAIEPGNEYDRGDLSIRVTWADGEMSWKGTIEFKAVQSSLMPDIKDIEMESVDARDIMAFAIALKNDALSSVGRSSDILEVDGFHCKNDPDATLIHNPFADLQYCDWQVDRRSTPTAIHLKPPVESYGAIYLNWRDKRAEILLTDDKPSLGF